MKRREAPCRCALRRVHVGEQTTDIRRIHEERTRRGWSTNELADRLTRVLRGDEVIRGEDVDLWELGIHGPSANAAMALCRVLELGRLDALWREVWFEYVPEALRQRRERYGYSVRAVARGMDVPPAMVRDIETGRIDARCGRLVLDYLHAIGDGSASARWDLGTRSRRSRRRTSRPKAPSRARKRATASPAKRTAPTAPKVATAAA